MKFKIIILFTLLLLGCSSKKKSLKKYDLLIKMVEKMPEKKNPLGFLFQGDTLHLTAKFSECGEFGGHKEKIQIYRNYKKEYFAKFTKDSIDLDCPNDFEEKAIIIQDTIIVINKSKEKFIGNYLNKLYKRAIIGKVSSHSNDYFSAKTNHTGLSLATAEPKKNWNEFRKLQIKLLK